MNIFDYISGQTGWKLIKLSIVLGSGESRLIKQGVCIPGVTFLYYIYLLDKVLTTRAENDSANFVFPIRV